VIIKIRKMWLLVWPLVLCLLWNTLKKLPYLGLLWNKIFLYSDPLQFAV